MEINIMIFSTSDRNDIKIMLTEITHCLSNIEQETQAKKDIVKTINEKFGLKPTVINKLAKTMYKQNYQEINNQNDLFEFLYQSIINDKQKTEK